MSAPKDVEYTVVLVTSTFGEARENAESIIESALDHLNTFREEPGFRFAPYVLAHLEIVSDIEEAQDRLENDDSVAMFIFHDVPDDERLPFARLCSRRNVTNCFTTPAEDLPDDRPRHPPPSEFKVVLRPRSKGEGHPGHHILDSVLTDSLDSDEEELQSRVWQLVAVMALGSSRVDLQACKLEYSIVSPK